MKYGQNVNNLVLSSTFNLWRFAHNDNCVPWIHAVMKYDLPSYVWRMNNHSKTKNVLAKSLYFIFICHWTLNDLWLMITPCNALPTLKFTLYSSADFISRSHTMSSIQCLKVMTIPPIKDCVYALMFQHAYNMYRWMEWMLKVYFMGEELCQLSGF